MSRAPSNSIHSRLAGLRAEAESLAPRLEGAAQALLDDGRSPGASLLADLRDWQSRLVEIAGTVGVEPTVDRIWHSLQQAADAHLRRDMLSAAADSLRSLSHRSDPNFAPLDEARAFVAKLLAESPAESAEIAKAESIPQAISALIRLVDQADELADAEWLSCQETASGQFGRPLALAAARGQLQLARTEVPPDDGRTHAPHQGDSTDAESTDAGRGSGHAPPLTSDPTTNAGDAPPAMENSSNTECGTGFTQQSSDGSDPEDVSARSAAAGEHAVIGSVFDDWAPPVTEREELARLDWSDLGTSMPSATRDAKSELQSLADAALRAPSEKRLTQLTTRLLADGYVEAAWRTAQLAAVVLDHQVSPQAESLKIWGLSGQVTATSQSAATELALGLIQAGSGAVNRAGELTPDEILVLAGALRAASRVPSTGACHTITQLAERIVSPHLRDFCVSMADVARRACAAGVSGRSDSRRESGRLDPLTWLQSLTQTWSDRWKQRAAAFARAEPLFVRRHWSVTTSPLQLGQDTIAQVSGWLHAVRLADTLIEPLIANDAGSLADVQKLAHRIARRTLVGRRDDHPPGIDAVVVPSQTIADYLHEAAALAQRWCDLRSPTARGDAEHRESPLTEWLKEVLPLQPEALADAHRVVNDSSSLLDTTAWECLRLAVQQVDDEGHEELNGADSSAFVESTSSTSAATAQQELQRWLTWIATDAGASDESLNGRMSTIDASQRAFNESNLDHPAQRESCGSLTCDDRSRDLELDEVAALLDQVAASGKISRQDREALQSRILTVSNIADRDCRNEALADLRASLMERASSTETGLTLPPSPDGPSFDSVLSDD